jgi:hypothetical protein
MERDQDIRSSIVIIEAGAGWPAWITEYQQRAPNAAVIAQTANEEPESFRARVLARLPESARGPSVLSVGIVLCSERATVEQKAAREQICRSIVNLLSSSGDLVLAANEGAESFKHELFALAGKLCEGAAVPRVNVRVRFAMSESGTMPSVLPGAVPARPNKAIGGV